MADMEQGAPDMAQDQAQPGPEGGSEGGVGEMISQLYDGLNMLATVIGKAQGVDPAIKQQMDGVLKGFEGVVQAMSGGQAQQGPAATGAAPMEAGGRGAMPAGPQTR